MRNLYAIILLSMAGLSAFADVLVTDKSPVIDGKLDDVCWKTAQWESGLTPIKNANYKTIPNDTHFAIVADKDAIYIAFRAFERDMSKLRSMPSRDMWHSEHVEIFISPSCNPLEFYQFCVSAPHGGKAQIYHIEGGLTHPDPYNPFWKQAISFEDGAWTAEMEIPLTALYNTRAEDWKRVWTVNVARDNNAQAGYPKSSWSELDRSFMESFRFRSMNGFPIRADEDDIAVNKAIADIKCATKGGLSGELDVYVYAKKGGMFGFSSKFCESKDVDLKPGDNVFSVKCCFPKNARYDVPLLLSRKSDGKVFGRSYPVPIDYDAVAVKFTKPAYRSNFYPGQDSSKIEGTVVCAMNEPVKLILEGDGIPRMEQTVNTDGKFSFDTPGFSGVATLTATCGGERRVKTLRKIYPNGRRICWIENGNLVVDGKRVFRRQFYAPGYASAKQYTERLLANPDYFLTEEANVMKIEFGRLVKGSEGREGVYDNPPSKEVLAAIDKRMLESKDKDFAIWYLCDEPECRSISPVYLRHLYDYIAERDPYHVVEICSRDVRRYIDSCDMVEVHPYLNPYYDLDGTRIHNVPLRTYGGFIDCIDLSSRPDKLVGNVPFAFTYRFASPTADYATFDEYVASVWAVLCEGAKTLYPFLAANIEDRPGLREGVKFVHSSIEELQDFLFAKRSRLFKNDRAVATVWEKGSGKRLVAVVNFTGSPRRVKVPLAKGVYREYRGRRTFRNVWGRDEVVFEMRPYDTIVVTDHPFESGFRLIDEVRGAVEREEWDRTHRNNQLLGRSTELGYATSDPKQYTMPERIVDGMYGQRAALLRGANPWIEISFPGDPITFRTVRIFGNNVEKATLKVCDGGVAKDVALVGRKVETVESNTCITLDLADRCTTGRMRVEFHKDRAEPFELEIPYAE